MLEIRRAWRCDAQAAYDIRLQAIRHQCGTAYSAEQVRAWTAVPLSNWYRDLVESHFYLACIKGRPIATGMIDLEKGEIGALFVLPEFMKRGVGKNMIAHLEDLARAAGLTDVHLEATLNAVDFYQRCGFTGDVESTYQSPSGLQLACIPMRKSLVGTFDCW
ncbi:GNAT family N-acetyltransferase [Metapseudomonas resinovorans]|uniref:N-acetyltransferase domain-containing protein n=1 Tax=Metapseudomonas resinovorans NBRC 106553 TaxID=1245471 RepID=S6BGH6_METRE|nr:GNAT family N-acetyltransferase [Pseudomonas resinovorans]BAN48194.1 hypothetical protein PCA10_24620 [Pseudomonas resinovorans NBRC 106553]